MSVNQTENASSSWQPLSASTPDYLAANLELLKVTDPPVYEILLARQPRLAEVEIRIENGQAVRARIRGNSADGGIPRDSFPLLPEENARQGFQSKIQSAAQRKAPFVVLAGSGYGWELARVHTAFEPSPESIVLVMERDPLALLIAFSLNDYRRMLLSGLTAWALGEPVGKRLIDVIRKLSLFLIFSNQIEMVFGSTASDDAAQHIYVDAFQNAIREITPYCEEFNRINQQFAESQQSRRGAPAHVWSSGAASEYTTTPILRALHRGLECAGLRSTFTALPRGRARNLVNYQGLIEANPDTILVVNDPSRGAIPGGEFHRMVWVTDDPTFRKNRRALPRYDARELVMYADPAYESALRGQGAERMLHLPVFALLETEGRYRRELAYPLVFVGMIWNMKPFFDCLTSSDRDHLEEIYDSALQSNEGTLGLRALWERRPPSPKLIETSSKLYALCGRTHEEPVTTMSYIVYMMDVYRRRQRMAAALLPLGLHVYGNKDWAPLLGDRCAERYHGFIPYENLGDLYRSAKITIGVHSLQLPTAINIRDCDILMAGGCLLSDPVQEMSEETIQPGRDCETASNASEFFEKARCLLEDDIRRNELAAQGRKTILDRYLPQYRAPIIIESLVK